MVVGASEDRLIGRIAGGMAEMESRLIRRMDTGFEEQARAMTHMESRLDARMDRMDVAIQEIRVNLARLATAIDGIIPRNTVK
jgi:division protein CdvB (Snf7/Vps24/ESCRT-III family)